MKTIALAAALACGTWSLVAVAATDPFASSRVAVAAPALAQDPAGLVKAVEEAQPKVNVLCGVRQSVDAVKLCLDGHWLELAAFEKKVKKSVVSIGALSVRLRPGGMYAIGDEVARSRARSKSQGEVR
jgi:hypothetical protein